MGAVVARNGEIIAAAHNTRETEKNALHHAELLAIDAACKKLGGWRLWQCELFVTLEPCPMCSGAIINSRIKRVVYGAADVKAGRAISAKNEKALRDAVEKISGAAGDLKNILAVIDGEEEDQEKASGHTEVKDEEPVAAKFEEPRVNPSAVVLATHTQLALMGSKES